MANGKAKVNVMVETARNVNCRTVFRSSSSNQAKGANDAGKSPIPQMTFPQGSWNGASARRIHNGLVA